jgi:transcriptional regulator of NAD metabolism
MTKPNDWEKDINEFLRYELSTHPNSSYGIRRRSMLLEIFEKALSSELDRQSEESENELRKVIQQHGALLIDGKMYALKHLTKMVVVNTGETIKIDSPITKLDSKNK